MPVKRDGGWSPSLPKQMNSSQRLSTWWRTVDAFPLFLGSIVIFALGMVVFLEIQSNKERVDEECNKLASEMIQTKGSTVTTVEISDFLKSCKGSK